MSEIVKDGLQTGGGKAPEKKPQAAPQGSAWADWDEPLFEGFGPDPQKGKKDQKAGLPRSVFWKITGTVIDQASRDQQVELARLIAGAVGGTLSFPNARESVLRQENAKLAQKLGGQGGRTASKAKPENVAMKGTDEEKNLHAAQKQLRELKLSLGLAKDNKTDPRLAEAVRTLENSKKSFDEKKAAVKSAKQ